MTIQERRQRVGRKAVENMQKAFYFYEKAENNFWDFRYHGWIAKADRAAKAAETQFEVSRSRNS